MVKRLKCFAGIGSRQTPPDIQELMTKIASFLESRKMILRSGAADGADAAFERGVKNPSMKEIYLPWRGFNDHPSDLYHVYPEALAYAAKFHPGWKYLSQGAQKLLARDCYQVVGPDLQTPVEFVVCWTQGGGQRGGTGQAIRIANDSSIPVFNIYSKSVRETLKECILSDQLFV